MHYRRELDGLRAVAVVPVILYHAGFTIFSGGFVGVDIFFVISGYLITSIIITELDQKRFSIVRFYERRARRILPALFFVMLCSIFFAWIWMLPDPFVELSKSVIATTLFSNNMLLWKATGYFSPAAELMPLLHTWSLGVEEQYYIIFPVFLTLFWRYGFKFVFYSVIAIAICSLLLSEWGSLNFPVANFYLAPFRVWELLAGSICAFIQFRSEQSSNNTLSIVGLSLIIFALVFFDTNTPTPSFYTLIPVVGACLIILFGTKTTWVARLLSMQGFVGIGLISYSAYLWHQPLFAFARIRSILEPDPNLMMLLAVGSLVLAYFSWKYIEQPFRAKPIPLLPSQRLILGTSVGIGLLFITFGSIGYLQNGFESRFGKRVLELAKIERTKNPYTSVCQLSPKSTNINHPLSKCTDFAIDNKFDVVFVGDSHSNAISYQAQRLLFENSISSYAVGFHACVGLEGFSQVKIKSKLKCNQYNHDIKKYMKNNSIPTIVVTSRFTAYWSGHPFDNAEGGVEPSIPSHLDLIGISSSTSEIDDTKRRQRVLKSYVEKILLLAEEFNVVLVYPIPEAGWNVPQHLSKLLRFSDDDKISDLSTAYSEFIARNSAVITAFDGMDHPNLYRVKPHKILCNTYLAGRCMNAIGGKVFYSDDDHLSSVGAELLAPYIFVQIEKIKNGASFSQSAVD